MQQRIDRALKRAFEFEESTRCPPRLLAAMRHAVFGGGGRVRPALTLLVAQALGDDEPGLSEAAAAAVELLHCASLVHDDMPTFDNAEFRRGQPTVHRRFGEPLALLVGDALIVRAFEVLAEAPTGRPERIPGIIRAVAAGVGAPRGLVAGQAWESEKQVDLTAYHRAKTAALFEASVEAGAAAAGACGKAWRSLGTRLGEAYQVADDLADVLSAPEETGKPTGQDAAHHRPSAVSVLGVEGAVARMGALIDETLAAVPACSGRQDLVRFLERLSIRLCPPLHEVRSAAVG